MNIKVWKNKQTIGGTQYTPDEESRTLILKEMYGLLGEIVEQEDDYEGDDVYLYQEGNFGIYMDVWGLISTVDEILYRDDFAMVVRLSEVGSYDDLGTSTSAILLKLNEISGIPSIVDGQTLSIPLLTSIVSTIMKSIDTNMELLSKVKISKESETSGKLVYNDGTLVASESGDSFDNAEVLRKFKEVREYVDGFDPDTATDEEKNNPANIKSSRLEWNESEVGGKDERVDQMLIGINESETSGIIGTIKDNLANKLDKKGDTMTGPLNMTDASLTFGSTTSANFEIVSSSDEDNNNFLEFKIINN